MGIRLFEVYKTLTIIIIKTFCMNNRALKRLCTEGDDDDKWCRDGWLPGKDNSVDDLLLPRCLPRLSKALIGIKGFGAAADFDKVGDICKLIEFSPCCIAAGVLSEKLIHKPIK